MSADLANGPIHEVVPHAAGNLTTMAPRPVMAPPLAINRLPAI
eukprot:CAMPEP_0184669694 /NCGR_PEP_ID=MMETSP0308-20130426/78667_1 /TAXON_ID=38269 /ORGANISM="Gloeochaete witrockiana, Strain SAG 46.84" /LENGTH=42 /DNA_ID= /DNA_START= /DNA_END= /DNA_ORIENTATION=